jgi:hypothetical protein
VAAPPSTLLGAVEALIDASAVGKALKASGGLWLGGVPEDLAVLPFLAIVHHGEVPTFDPAGGLVEEVGHFDLVVTGRQPLGAVEALAGQVKALFDPNPGATPGGFVELQVAYAAVAWAYRLDYQVERLRQRAADGAYVYQVTMPYESHVEPAK